jgi:hypothetical protein
MKNSLLTAAFVFALAAPALAAGQSYVALDTSTRECHVMDTRPDGTTQKMVGSGAYKTEAEAEQAIQSTRISKRTPGLLARRPSFCDRVSLTRWKRALA